LTQRTCSIAYQIALFAMRVQGEYNYCLFSKIIGNPQKGSPKLVPDVVNRTDKDTVLFTPNVVRDVLRKLKATTSAGSDGIPNVFLKKLC